MQKECERIFCCNGHEREDVKHEHTPAHPVDADVELVADSQYCMTVCDDVGSRQLMTAEDSSCDSFTPAAGVCCGAQLSCGGKPVQT